MKSLFEKTDDGIKVSIKDYFRKNCQEIIFEINVYGITSAQSLSLIGKVDKLYIVCDLIWDKNKEDFVKCERIGLFDNQKHVAETVSDISDLSSAINKHLNN